MGLCIVPPGLAPSALHRKAVLRIESGIFYHTCHNGFNARILAALGEEIVGRF
jgi:hypothetical protein